MSNEFEPPGISLLRRVYQSIFEALLGRDARSRGTRNSKIREIDKLLELARDQYKSHLYGEARHLNQQAFLLSQFYGLETGKSISLCQLATTENVLSDYDAAREHAATALKIMQQNRDLAHQARALLNLGIACREFGDFASAARYLNEAQARAVEQVDAVSDKGQDPTPQQQDLADIYLALGNLALYQGRHGEAIYQLKRSWQSANLFQDESRAFTAAIDLVFVYVNRQDWVNALATLIPALGYHHPTHYKGREWAILLGELDKRCSQIQTYSRINYVLYIMRGYACQILQQTDRAVAHYETIWRFVERARSQLKNPAARVTLLGASLSVVQLALKLALETQDRILAYDWIERYKSRSMLDLLDYPVKYKTESSGRHFDRWSGDSTGFSKIQGLIN
jgi:tetratricopeptide (TPR) repeat protein